MIKRILLFGENGQLAQELKASLANLGVVQVLGSKQCSFENADLPVRAIREMRPDIIVNAAAYTNTEKAEDEEERASKINGHTVGSIAEVAKKLNISLVHYSTDYVFDGTKSVPWTEEDSIKPLNAYGRSKALGEKMVQDVGGSYFIFRVSWLYSNQGSNFFKTMLRLGLEREELRVIEDQFGAPTWCRDIAQATSQVLGDFAVVDKSGLYHLSAQGITSWFGFCQAIFRETARATTRDLKLKHVVPIKSHEYPSKIQRPAYSVLSNDHFYETFGFRLPEWQESLKRVVAAEFEQ